MNVKSIFLGQLRPKCFYYSNLFYGCIKPDSLICAKQWKITNQKIMAILETKDRERLIFTSTAKKGFNIEKKGKKKPLA